MAEATPDAADAGDDDDTGRPTNRTGLAGSRARTPPADVTTDAAAAAELVVTAEPETKAQLVQNWQKLPPLGGTRLIKMLGFQKGSWKSTQKGENTKLGKNPVVPETRWTTLADVEGTAAAAPPAADGVGRGCASSVAPAALWTPVDGDSTTWWSHTQNNSFQFSSLSLVRSIQKTGHVSAVG